MIDPAVAGGGSAARAEPARIVEGQPEGGYTDVFEIICCYCGDHPYLDYREVSPELQRLRGPYPIAAGAAVYEEHLLDGSTGLHEPAIADTHGIDFNAADRLLAAIPTSRGS